MMHDIEGPLQKLNIILSTSLKSFSYQHQKVVIECHMIQKVEQNIARPQEIKKSVIFGTVDLDPLYIDVVVVSE